MPAPLMHACVCFSEYFLHMYESGPSLAESLASASVYTCSAILYPVEFQGQFFLLLSIRFVC